MREWAVEVQVAPAAREAAAQRLASWTGRAVEERADGALLAVVPSLREARALLDLVGTQAPGIHATCSPLPDVDWSERWKDGLAPRRVGRLTISPTWCRLDQVPEEERVMLDPGRAFGSGEHGSTRAALLLLERMIRPGDTVVDCGSGSGVLGIAAARYGAARVIGIDHDADAVAVAEANAVSNSVADRVSFIVGDAHTLVPLLAPFDLLVANILRPVLETLLPVVAQALRPGRMAILSGLEGGEVEPFLRRASANDFQPLAQVSDDGWHAVALERR